MRASHQGRRLTVLVIAVALTVTVLAAFCFITKHLGIADWCDAWLKAGSPHHMALAYGHLADKLRKIAELGGWDFIEV